VTSKKTRDMTPQGRTAKDVDAELAVLEGPAAACSGA